MNKKKKETAYYHLPGLFEFYELYRKFLALFYEHREYFKVTIIGYCIVHGGMNEYLVAWGNREKINRAIE